MWMLLNPLGQRRVPILKSQHVDRSTVLLDVWLGFHVITQEEPVFIKRLKILRLCYLIIRDTINCAESKISTLSS